MPTKLVGCFLSDVPNFHEYAAFFVVVVVVSNSLFCVNKAFASFLVFNSLFCANKASAFFVSNSLFCANKASVSASVDFN